MSEATNSITAEAATLPDGVPRHGRVLIGTFGREGALSALIRTQSGEIARVSQGDSLDGAEVIAIETGRVTLARGNNTEVLALPGAG